MSTKYSMTARFLVTIPDDDENYSKEWLPRRALETVLHDGPLGYYETAKDSIGVPVDTEDGLGVCITLDLIDTKLEG